MKLSIKSKTLKMNLLCRLLLLEILVFIFLMYMSYLSDNSSNIAINQISIPKKNSSDYSIGISRQPVQVFPNVKIGSEQWLLETKHGIKYAEKQMARFPESSKEYMEALKLRDKMQKDLQEYSAK